MLRRLAGVEAIFWLEIGHSKGENGTAGYLTASESGGGWRRKRVVALREGEEPVVAVVASVVEQVVGILVDREWTEVGKGD